MIYFRDINVIFLNKIPLHPAASRVRWPRHLLHRNTSRTFLSTFIPEDSSSSPHFYTRILQKLVLSSLFPVHVSSSPASKGPSLHERAKKGKGFAAKRCRPFTPLLSCHTTPTPSRSPLSPQQLVGRPETLEPVDSSTSSLSFSLSHDQILRLRVKIPTPLMALCHLRNPLLFTSRELQPVPSVSRLAEERLRWDAQRSPSCRVLLLECSAKKSRGSRKPKTTRSNTDLCNELRHFVFAMGLPENHVPSTKELLEHGRWVALQRDPVPLCSSVSATEDLAYIVRRKGHKEITKLLMNSTTGDSTTEKQVENDCHFGKVSTEESIDVPETRNIYDVEAESSHEGTTSCRQSSEVKIAGGIDFKFVLFLSLR
ncbi:hypothetical protein Taro_013081 [Colocasia esculenta]|uniref:Uncharacterized protein n=1 Tax=Colocasia esculenta TaxID=4460 RepID=A0A843UF99_COLES|nr:hypothetical protein [Colocasia esculenta]